MNKGTIRGSSADVRWGYHTAVALGPWTVAIDATERKLTARVVRVDTLRSSQHPLTFVVSRPNGVQWRFPVESLQIAGHELEARLGPQE